MCYQRGIEMTEEERKFLEDTCGILVGYDGCGTVDSLKELIDETRERIGAVLDGKVSEYKVNQSDYGFKKYYESKLKDCLEKESKGQLKDGLAYNLAKGYVDNLHKTGGLKSPELMNKSIESVARDMVNGLKSDCFKDKE